jgi:hypothetical protein
MFKYHQNKFIFFILPLLACILGAGISLAEEKRDMGGWEEGSTYNQLYDPKEMEKFKAIAMGFKKIVPLPGMAPGVALRVRESEDEIIIVHLGPEWYVDPNSIQIKKGDKIKIRGVWAEVNGADVFIASKVKKGDYYEYKVRLTKNGKPFWTMSPEELAREKASK